MLPLQNMCCYLSGEFNRSIVNGMTANSYSDRGQFFFIKPVQAAHSVVSKQNVCHITHSVEWFCYVTRKYSVCLECAIKIVNNILQ